MKIEVKGKTYTLNLDNVDNRFVEQAISSFIAGDVTRFLASTGDASKALKFALDNSRALDKRDIFERCLFQAWIDAKMNSGSDGHADLQDLFDLADVAKLQSFGDPVGTEPITAYRAASGIKRHEKPKGFCWSESLDAACRLASQLESPAIYAATLAPEEIFFITNHRGERDVICQPGSIERLKLSASEIKRRAKQHAARADDDPTDRSAR